MKLSKDTMHALNIILDIFLFVLVEELPSGHEKYYGIAALSTTDGPIVSIDKSLYNLKCTLSSCTWIRMENELERDAWLSVVMSLPSKYSCQGESDMKFMVFFFTYILVPF